MADKFTWIPVYREIAQRLLDWEGRQGDLIAFLEQLRSQGLTITPLTDQDDKGLDFFCRKSTHLLFLASLTGVFEKNSVSPIIAEVIKLLACSERTAKGFRGPSASKCSEFVVYLFPARAKSKRRPTLVAGVSTSAWR